MLIRKRRTEQFEAYFDVEESEWVLFIRRRKSMTPYARFTFNVELEDGGVSVDDPQALADFLAANLR